MEVNINNAFLLAVKVSLEYGQACFYYNNLYKGLKGKLDKITLFLLENPLFTTMCLSIITGSVSIALTSSVILFLFTFLVTGIIIIVEGLTILLITTLVIQILILIITTTIIAVILKKLLSEFKMM